jgi:next-to-BRCA1 protein 1
MNPSTASPDSLINVSTEYQGKIICSPVAMRDLTPDILPAKVSLSSTLLHPYSSCFSCSRLLSMPQADLQLRALFKLPAEADLRIERFSATAAEFVFLDPDQPAIYKQLCRAAKAKRTLCLKMTPNDPAVPRCHPDATPDDDSPPSHVTAESKARPERIVPLLPKGRYNGFAPPPFVESGRSAHSFSVREEADSDDVTTAPRAPLSFKPAEDSSDNWITSGNCIYSVCCNACRKSLYGEHYHCGTCDAGDYDLCTDCLDSGIRCRGDDHWMIKRWLEAGRVRVSSTETIPPKARNVPEQPAAPESSTAKNSPKASAQVPPASSSPVAKQHVAADETHDDDVFITTCNGCLQRKSLPLPCQSDKVRGIRR